VVPELVWFIQTVEKQPGNSWEAAGKLPGNSQEVTGK